MAAISAVRYSAANTVEDGPYRYVLNRWWSTPPQGRCLTFLMLNPSTADAVVDDPTVRRCVGFARAWGYDGLRVVNLYAYRATSPRDLFAAADPVGPQNDSHLSFAVGMTRMRDAPGFMVAAWGTHARPDRVASVAAMAGPLMALGVTKDGHPQHPLYVPASATLQSYAIPDTAAVS